MTVAIELQIISKIINDRDISILRENDISHMFSAEFKPKIEFIEQHYDEYGEVPTEDIFLSKFEDIPELYEIVEPTSFLIDGITESYNYAQLRDISERFEDLTKDNANKAIEYLKAELANLETSNTINEYWATTSRYERLAEFDEMLESPDCNFIPTGFDELDKDIGGFRRGNELVVLYARMNQGKSWVLEKICTAAAVAGYKVGYFSPEMSKKDVAYRFDTLYGHIPNSFISSGMSTQSFSRDDYAKYIEELSLAGDIAFATPRDFQRKTTVSKLRGWVNKLQLDMLAIDGITYLQDERFKKGDSKTISLTNISEDLMGLSEELKIPIIVVVQANRGGVVDKSSLDTPDLENIRDSDGIAQNASIVYAIRQTESAGKGTVLLLENKKMRMGKVGKQYKYYWDIDVGKFEYAENVEVKQDNEGEPRKYRRENNQSEPTRRKKVTEEDVF